MSAAHLRFGIPDIDLPLAGGGTVNPSAFAGHILVVQFRPVGRPPEPGDFSGRDCSLSEYDGWLLRIRASRDVPDGGVPCAGSEAVDDDDRAWTAFRQIVPSALELDRSEGATLLFARGGSLERVWPGVGHATEVIDELARPSSGAEGIGVASGR